VKNIVVLAIVLGIIGIVIGYLIFGRYALGNELIPVGRLFSIGDSGPVGAVFDIAGFAAKRQNIYISGGVGVLAGAILGIALRRRR
jgi:hypothetical protein